MAPTSPPATGTSVLAEDPSRPVEDGWYPGEKLAFSSSTTYRAGRTPRGFAYDYFRDGSGGVRKSGATFSGGWTINCEKDAMNDRRNCRISSTDNRIMILYDFSSAPKFVCIVGHDFPGRTGQIRVDANKPVTTDTDGCVGAAYVAQLTKGSMVPTRRVERPYDYGQDDSGPLAGLPDAVDLVSFIRANVDSKQF